MSGASWLVEGTAWRTPVQRFPIVHLLVADTDELWCTGSKGRRDNPVRMQGERVCKKCQQLALDAIEDETLDEQDVPRFIPEKEVTAQEFQRTADDLGISVAELEAGLL